MKSKWIATLHIGAAAASVAGLSADSLGAPQVHFASATTTSSVFVLEDINGDGDALDIGEVQLWATNLGAPQGIATRGAVVWVVDAALGDGCVWRCEDINLDGDALDTGEVTLWASGFAEPRGIALADDGSLYVSNLVPGEIWRINDINLDGDALDTGEVRLFASSTSQLEGLLLRPDGLYAASVASSTVFRFNDVNADGDALDTGEMHVHAEKAGAKGLLDIDGAAYYVSGDSAVSRVQDGNGDDDALDAGELLPYAADGLFSLLGAAMLAQLDSNDALLAVVFEDTVLRIGDQNNDGDALDIGEVHRYCTINHPYGIAARDRDGDGVSDGIDNCPDTFNPSQLDTNDDGIGNACETCPADINGDGVVNVTDLLALLAAWGPNPGHPADINDDDVVNVTDLLALLAAWGPC